MILEICPICEERKIEPGTIMCKECFKAGKAREPAYSNDDYTEDEWEDE